MKTVVIIRAKASEAHPEDRTGVSLENYIDLNVDLKSWDFPDLSFYAVMVSPEVAKAIATLEEQIGTLISGVRSGTLPESCSVPDLWHHRKELANEDGHDLFSQVANAVKICESFYRQRETFFVDGIKHWRFSVPGEGEPYFKITVPNLDE